MSKETRVVAENVGNGSVKKIAMENLLLDVSTSRTSLGVVYLPVIVTGEIHPPAPAGSRRG